MGKQNAQAKEVHNLSLRWVLNFVKQILRKEIVLYCHLTWPPCHVDEYRDCINAGKFWSVDKNLKFAFKRCVHSLKFQIMGNKDFNGTIKNITLSQYKYNFKFKNDHCMFSRMNFKVFKFMIN